MNLFKSNKGAVSVFLVIILVPTLIVTSIFVDVSRMFLSKSVTESAADLALNSQLSQFDKELNDMYGLFANAQSVDDVSTNLDKYFESCLVSSGVETTDASKYGKALSDLIDEELGEEYSDLLQISSSDDTSITPITDANLANSQVLKNQIVSFMKYRGPVNIIEGFFSDITEVKDQVDIVDEETEITDTMSQHFESQNKVLTELKDAYFDIKDYKTNSGMTTEYVDNLKDELGKIEDEYKTQHIKMFKDLYNTQGVSIDTSYPTIHNFTYYKNCKEKDSDCKKISKDMTDDTFNGLVKSAQSEVDEFETFYDDYKLNFYDKLAPYIHMANGVNGVFSLELNDNVYPIQWYVYASEISDDYLSEYSNKANKMVHSVARAFYAAEKSGKTSVEYEQLISDYEKFALNPNKSDTEIEVNAGMYITYRYHRPVALLIQRVYDNYVKNNTSTESVNQYLIDTSTYLKNQYTKIEKAKKLISNAKKHLEKAYSAYIDEETGIPKTLENWEDALNNPNLEGKSSAVQTESQNAYDGDKEFRENVTEKTINELKTRIENIETLLQNMLDYINGIKYNGHKVKDIDSYNKFRSKSGINEDDIVIDKTNLDNNAKNSFKFSYPDVDITISKAKNNNPDIDTNSPKLYTYLENEYKSLSKESNEDDEKVKEYKEKKGENDGNETITIESDSELSDNEIGSGDTEETQTISKKINNISENIKGFFGGVGDYINDPSLARDDLYVLEYAMSMFSYHTYNKEGLYNLAYSEGEEGLDDRSTVISLRSKYAEAWKNTDTVFTENKSLTNYMINKDNNYSFGNEIEYILNGGTNSQNKSAVAGKIFMMRFAFNLGPMFSDNWSKLPLRNFAESINAMCPYIPAALVKVVVILAVTAAEAAHDLACLKEGMKVALVKDTDDLEFTWNKPKTQKKEDSEIKGMQYSDYLYLFLFLDLINNSKEDEVLSRIGDVIARNVGMKKGYDNNEKIFDLSKSYTYYTFNGKVQVEPLLLSIPLLNDEKYNKSSTVSWWQWDYSLTRGYN